MASQTMQYIIPLLGGSAAAIGAAFFGNSIKEPVEEAPVEESPETPVEASTEEPPVEQSVEEQPVEETPVEQSGGAFGRPSWAPYTGQQAVSAQPISTVVSNIVQSIPSNSAAIQQELSKVTTDWENVSYELYNLGVKQKTILDKMNGSTGNPGIREVYRTALAKVNAGKIQIEFLTKQIENYNTKTESNGFDLLKSVFGDKVDKTEDEKQSKNGKNHATYLSRIDELVKNSSNPSISDLKRSGSDNLDKWWNLIKNNKSSSNASKPKLEELVDKLTNAEKTIYTNEDIVSENKDEYERLSSDLTDIRAKRVEKERLKSSLNERRLALINALSKTDKSISDVTTRFRPVSDSDLKNILLEYNKALLELEQKEKELKVWYIQNYMNATDKASKDADFTAKKKEVEDAKQTVERIRIQLSGQSSQEASPLDTIIFELKKNGVSGTVALTNLVPIFDMYYEISKQTTASKVVENLTKYYNMFIRGFDSKLVDEAFVYLSELSKRSVEAEYSEKLKDFIEKNKTIVYNAYANLQLTKEKIEKGANPVESLNTSEAVKALLEGKTVSQYRLTKSKNVFNWGKTNEQKINSLVENFGKKVIDKLETAKVGRYWFRSQEEVQLQPKKEVSERVTELAGLFTTKNAGLRIPVTDQEVEVEKSKVEELRSIAQQLKLLLQSEDEVVPLLNKLLKEGFTGGALSSENEKFVASLSKLLETSGAIDIELFNSANRKPVVNIERLMRETIKARIDEINYEYTVLEEYMLKTLKEQDKPIYRLRLIKPKILNLHKNLVKFKEFLSKIEGTTSTVNALIEMDNKIESVLTSLNDVSADTQEFKFPKLSIKLPDISAWIPKISFKWFWNFFKAPEPVENKDSTEYPSQELEDTIGQITEEEEAAEKAHESKCIEHVRSRLFSWERVGKKITENRVKSLITHNFNNDNVRLCLKNDSITIISSADGDENTKEGWDIAVNRQNRIDANQPIPTQQQQNSAAGTGIGGNHHTRRHWVRSKPSRFKTQRTY